MKRLTRRLPRPRGQAMVEYSFIAHALLVVGTFGGTWFVTYLINALTKYFESIYWVLTSPIP